MKLYLMRHGEALSSQQDPERGLSENGKEMITRLAQQLVNENIHFKHIFHSGKKRTRETAEIVAAATSPDITPQKIDDITPNSDPVMVIDEIESWDEDTLLVSHLPFIPNLINMLTSQNILTSSISFEPGTIIALEQNSTGIWKITWSTSPSELT